MVQQNAVSTELDHAEIRGYLSWHHPFRTIQIYMHPSAVGTLQNRVLLGWFAAHSSEVGGILLGKILPGKPERCVVIDDLQFIEPTTALFNASEVDRSRLDAAIKQVRADSGLTPVGYFRSHIRPGLCLSPQDKSFIEANLRDPDDVFLLIRPNEIGVCEAAFFFWQRGQLQTDISDLKLVSISDESAANGLPPNQEAVPPQGPVPVIAECLTGSVHADGMNGCAAGETPDAKSRDEAPRDITPGEIKTGHTKAENNGRPAHGGDTTRYDERSTAADATHHAEHGAVASYEPQANTRQAAPVPSGPHAGASGPYAASQRLNLLVWALACMLAAALCVIGYVALQAGSRKQGAGSNHAGTDIGLRVDAVPGGQLNVSWNQDMPQLAQMRHAALTIVDGTVRRDLDIDNSQFRFGKLTYVPNSTDVQFQLEVFLPGNRSMAESVRVVVSTPQGGTFQAELAPPRVIESPKRASIEPTKQRAAVDASPRAAAAARFTAPIVTPVFKKQTDSTSLLSAITAPAVPASPSHDLPPSVTESFSYVPPARDVEPPATVEPFKAGQNMQSSQSTFIPAPNGAHAARVARLDTGSSTAPGSALTSHEASPRSATRQQSSLAEDIGSQTQTGAAYTPPVAVREVRPTVPLGLLGIISSEQAVEVLVNIDTSGRVSEARLLGSKGAISGLLSQAALAAAREYRFRPARHNGVPIASRLTITFRFVR